MSKSITILQQEAVNLLQQLIAIPSHSREEAGTAACIAAYLQQQKVTVSQYGNNVVARSIFFDAAKPTVLLNSHHDTVPPNNGYTNNPYQPIIADGKLFGLGSNDAGGSLVALTATFLYYSVQKDLPYNIVLAASAEEEVSGEGGIAMLLPLLGAIDCAIVGEPTLLQMAIAEKGLLVLDGLATGRAGHAARNEGDNALYTALQDIERLRRYQFEKTSPLLGPVSINVASIATSNKAHNVVPADCSFVVDIRVNEFYTHQQVLDTLQPLVKSSLTPRSMRLQSSGIEQNHPLVQAGSSIGLAAYGSPTLSDMALIPFPALKIGPGDSARSHTADEFIYVEEINKGVETYIQLINALVKVKNTMQ